MFTENDAQELNLAVDPTPEGVEPEAVETTDAPAEPEAVETTDAPTEAEAVETTDAPAEPEAVEATDAPAEAEAVETTDAPAEPEAVETTDPPAEAEAVEEADAEAVAPAEESETPERGKLEELSEKVRELSERIDAAKLDALSGAVQELSGKLAELSKLFDNRIMHAEHEEKVIDRMHKELQQYKQDLYAQILRPVLLDIATTRDSILTTAARRTANGQTEIPANLFSSYAEGDLYDILEKNEVEIYHSKPGTAFDALRQRAIHKTPTQDAALHGKIASSFSGGYLYHNRVLSPEKVSVYVFQASSGDASAKS